MIRTIGGKPILLLAKEGGYSSSDEGRLADQFRGQVGAGPTDGAIVYRMSHSSSLTTWPTFDSFFRSERRAPAQRLSAPNCLMEDLGGR